jgi:predicted RNase H-like nuclease
VHVILGIDAAWTDAAPSGIALVVGEPKAWRCACVAPSYESFIACASGHEIDWRTSRISGTAPDVDKLVSAATALAGAEPTLVAIDMPMANVAFSGRRAADQAISKAFGTLGCSTHSPTVARPGRLGAKLTADLRNAGYPLATCEERESCFSDKKAIEVFPHPALVVLLERAYRLPYKVSKSTRYWQTASIQQRTANLLVQFADIDAALQRCFGATNIELPTPAAVRRLSHLKPYEDALDALSCAWVATQCVEGTATPYGDETSAIWVPHAIAER